MAAVVENPPCVDEIEKLKKDDPLEGADVQTEQAKKKKKKKKKKKNAESPEVNENGGTEVTSPEGDIVQQMDNNTIEEKEGLRLIKE